MESQKTCQISKQLTEAMLNDVAVNCKLGRSRQGNDPRYIYSEVFELIREPEVRLSSIWPYW